MSCNNIYIHCVTGGRLPLTWYNADYVDMLPMTSMPLRPVDSIGYPGRTCKFFNGSTVYPFGYGLSYTQFNYTLTAADKSVDILLNNTQHCRYIKYEDAAYKPSCPAVLVDDVYYIHDFSVKIQVKNVGKRDGSEVVFVYSKPPEGIAGTHAKRGCL